MRKQILAVMLVKNKSETILSKRRKLYLITLDSYFGHFRLFSRTITTLLDISNISGLF